MVNFNSQKQSRSDNVFNVRNARLHRARRQFVPTLGGFAGTQLLEKRSLTSSLFWRSSDFDAQARAGSSSEAFLDNSEILIGTGTGLDDIYAAYAYATTSANGWRNGQPGSNQGAIESSEVTNTITGPGSGISGDPNGSQSTPAIQFDVNHTSSDTFVNNTNGSIRYRPSPDQGIGVSSSADSGPTGNNVFGYVIHAGTPGQMATVSLNFQATLSSTGQNSTTNQSIQNNQFIYDAELGLHSDWLNVTINRQSGLLATDGNGNTIYSDPNFETNIPFSNYDSFSIPAFNVPDGTAFTVTYQSSFTNAVSQGGAVFAPGNTTDNSQFHWTMNIQGS